MAPKPRLAATLLCLLVMAGTAVRADGATDGVADRLVDDGRSSVVEVIDGDTVILEDGREVRLVGTQAPKLPLGRVGFAEWPLAPEAKAALSELALGRTVRAMHHPDGQPMDRHGRVLAHLFLDDGTWVQGWMVENGWARVYTFEDNRGLAAELLARERTARQAERGIWDHPYYVLRDPESVAGDVDTFQVVEGRVVEAAVVGGRAYLNFGRNWREDFTVFLQPGTRRLFEDEGIDIEDLAGRRIRVRGWVEEYNGPEIEATHPEQIEVLDP